MRKRLLTLLPIGLLLATGCQTDIVHSVMRADPARLSDFLPNHDLLARQSNSFPFHYFYLNPKAASYANIVIAPVDTGHLRRTDAWADFDHKLNGGLGNDIAALSEFMRNAYAQAFRKARRNRESRLTVTDNRDLPGTLVLELALVSIVPSKAELNALGLAGSFFIPGLMFAASLVSDGSVTVECRVRDAKTGEIIAMYGDTETDPKALIPISSYTWTSSARINIKAMAAHTAQVLGAKDYHQIRRDFPFRLMTRVLDGELDG